MIEKTNLLINHWEIANVDIWWLDRSFMKKLMLSRIESRKTWPITKNVFIGRNRESRMSHLKNFHFLFFLAKIAFFIQKRSYSRKNNLVSLLLKNRMSILSISKTFFWTPFSFFSLRHIPGPKSSYSLWWKSFFLSIRISDQNIMH